MVSIMSSCRSFRCNTTCWAGTKGCLFPFRLLALLAFLVVGGCKGFSGSPTLGNSLPAGNYVQLSQHCYPNFFPNTQLNNSDVDELHNKLVSAGWSRIEYVQDDPTCSGQAGYPLDPAVHASMFTDGTAQNSADFVYFSGHGDIGVTALYQYDPSTQDCYNNGEADITCFWYETGGTPTSGRLKWIMSFASQDTGDNHWPYIFNTVTNGLHGYYGIEGEPGSLNDTGNAFADAFANDALSAASNGPESVHSAWIHAAQAINAPVGEWELQSALSDKLSSQSSSYGQYSSGNPVVHTNQSGQTLFPLSLSSLNTKSPGLYQPRVLTTESYSDSALGQKVDQNESGSLKYYPTSNQYRVLGQSGTGSHYEASGAILASSENSSLAETFSQQDALTFAQQSAQQNNPLPSDAQLQYAVSVYRTPVSQAPILMGYEFTWVHSNLMLGGDFVKMGVDNVSKRVCTDWTQNDPPYHNHCIAWETQYSQHLNYYYRLWRQRSGALAAKPRRVQTSAVNSPALSPAQAYSIVSKNPRIRGAHLEP